MTGAVIALSASILLLEQKNGKITGQRLLTESAQRKSDALNRFLIDDVYSAS